MFKKVSRKPAAVLAGVLLLSAVVLGGIVDSPHNLSVSGPGDIKSPEEKQICIFCHTPHNASPEAPLWNRPMSSVTNYTMYWSATMQAYPSQSAAPQPDGASKLCLSCHDGTIALGAVRSRSAEAPVSGGPTLPSTSATYLGTDLTGMHPISFVFDDALAVQNNSAGDLPLKMASSLSDPNVKLDRQGKIQCTTCHDPHDDSNSNFLVKPTRSELCQVCHDI